mgnify:CR=1 FL=1
MMEYIGVGLVIVIGLAIYLGRPRETYKFLAGTVVNKLMENEPEIVKGLYNRLPAPIKQNVSSKEVAKIVEAILSIIIDIIVEDADKK